MRDGAPPAERAQLDDDERAEHVGASRAQQARRRAQRPARGQQVVHHHALGSRAHCAFLYFQYVLKFKYLS